MSTARTWQTESTSLEDTLALAERIGRKLKGGEVIELVSDLGGGKTSFVKGLATGLGSRDTVHSPSFTFSNRYHAGNLTLYHFDFYRLKEAGIMRDELSELLDDSGAVVAVEWGGIVADVLPADRVTVSLKPTGETTRLISFEFPAKLEHLFPTNT